MSITNPTPGGSFGGDGSAVSGSGRTPGGQFSGIGRIGTNGTGLSDTILWIGPEPPNSTKFLLWINTSDGRWYGYWFDGTSTQWVDLSLPFGEGLVGPKGLTGDTGLVGPVGQGIPIGGDADKILVKVDGTDFNTYWGDRPVDGNLIIYGSVAPTTEGADGDAYIDSVTYTLYGPKAGGVWPAGVSLIGPTGVTGDTGAAGTDGTDGTNGTNGVDGQTVLNGAVAPTTEGVDGDFYIDTVSNEIYGPKSGGVWGAGTSIVGPAGPAGADGADGEGVPVGGTAGQVLAKIDAANFNTEWVDAAAGGGGSMDQVEITADHTITEANLGGSVVIRANNSGLNTLVITVPPSLVNEQPVTVIATNSGGVYFTEGAGVTILVADNNKKLRVPYSSATLIPDVTTADTYYLLGDLVELDDMVLPASIPAPIVWISPRNVETDIDGNVTKFLNRGTGGATYDATPTGTEKNLIAVDAGWNGRDTIVIPDVANGGYQLGSTVANTRTVFTITSYRTIGQATFTDFDGLISGPVGAGSEFQLVGNNSSSSFLIGRAQTIYKNDVSGASVLPLDKDTVGSTNSADGLFTQTLWYDNAGVARNWVGINGDMMIWNTELTGTQLTALQTLFTDYYGTGDGS